MSEAEGRKMLMKNVRGRSAKVRCARRARLEIFRDPALSRLKATADYWAEGAHVGGGAGGTRYRERFLNANIRVHFYAHSAEASGVVSL